MEGNFGGCKLWRIWRKIVQPPIFKPPMFFLYTKRLLLIWYNVHTEVFQTTREDTI